MVVKFVQNDGKNFEKALRKGLTSGGMCDIL